MRTVRWLSWSGLLVLGLFLAGSLPVRADALAEVKAKRAVEAQRVEKLVADAMTKAVRLQQTRPSEANEILRNILAVLETDTALVPERREALMRQVRQYAKQLAADAADGRSGGNPTPVRIGSGEQRRVEEEKKRADAEYITRMQGQINQARLAGNSREAARLQAELSQRQPGNPAVEASRTVGGIGDAVAMRGELSRMRSEGVLRVGESIERANLVPTRDMTFPRDWAEKTRKRSNAMLITEKEKAILKALDTLMEVDFNNTTFQEVIDYLQKRTGVTIAVDKLSLGDAGITYETPVTAKIRASTRGVLRKILGELNLTYIVKDEAIQITTVPRAQATLTTRNYYVGDLVAATGMGFNPLFNQIQMAAAVQQLAVLITQTVEPASWAVNGGLGTIAFNPITMSFMVRQTAEMHYMMGARMR